jgi:hypothetical protein
MDVEEVELHDAFIKCAFSNCVARTVLKMEYYRKDSSVREPIAFLFEGVKLVSQIMSMERLGSNAFAGNVNYWIPQHGGVTYIYLSDGCISIEAERISFDVGAG